MGGLVLFSNLYNPPCPCNFEREVKYCRYGLSATASINFLVHSSVFSGRPWSLFSGDTSYMVMRVPGISNLEGIDRLGFVSTQLRCE
jgi:hypothetical protein